MPLVAALFRLLYNLAFRRKAEVMLKQLSRFKHTRNLVIVGFILFMAVSLVFFYKPGGSTNLIEPTKNATVAAKVNGEEITVADIAQVKENYQSMFGGQISLAQLG